MRLEKMLLLKGEADGIQGAYRYALFANNAAAQIKLQLPFWCPATQSTTRAHTGADAAIHATLRIDMYFSSGTGDL
jgi:hypothetical protein